MKNRKPTRWKGDLAKPIRWEGPLSDPAPAMIDERRQRIQQQFLEEEAAWREEISRKLYLLKKHFGIQAGPPGDRDLATRLAIEFVPGFQIDAPVKSRGRPRSKWTHGQYLGLLFDVERIKEDLGAASDIAALEALVISPNDYFSDKPPRSESLRDQRARSLNSRLTEGRRLVEKQEVQFLFAPEKRELMRRVFAHGSPVRRCNFY